MKLGLSKFCSQQVHGKVTQCSYQKTLEKLPGQCCAHHFNYAELINTKHYDWGQKNSG